MATAQVSKEKQPGRPADEISAQTSEVLVKLSTQARALQMPTMACAAVSLGAAFITWFLSYARFIADSAASAIACVALLAALLLPGAILLWIHASLRRVTKLPGRYNLPAQELPTVPQIPPEEPGDDSPVSRLVARVRRRAALALEVWTRLEYSEGIKEVGGPRWFLAFLIMPGSRVVVAGALAANAFVVLVAVYTLLRTLLRMVF